MRNKTILAVDDLKFNRSLYKEILGSQYDLLLAEDGRQALNILEENRGQVALIITDIYMPIMDGFGLLDSIQRNPDLNKIPVIAVTAVQDHEIEIKALNKGAIELVLRPFEPRVLLRRIENILKLADVEKAEREARKELEKALKDAQKAAAAKQEFLARMSHEFRTPLNGIRGSLYLLRERKELSDDICLNNAIISVDHLTSLINDVLDMAKIESGKMVLKREILSSEQLFVKLKAIMEPIAREKGLKLLFRREKIYKEYIYTDANRLEQIMINLLSNAVKYTEPGGTVKFTIDSEPLDDKTGRITFYISDNGIGMHPEFLQRAFESFEQEQTAGNVAGTGLGLAITKNLLDLMGGRIKVESQVGKGTRVTVVLDAEWVEDKDVVVDEALPYRLKDGGGSADFTGKRVLLVEDNEINMQIAQLQLETMGFRVEKAYDGQEAVAMFEKSEEFYYDVICMDIMMPRLDGYGASRKIRSLERKDASGVIIIAMTANAFAEDVQLTYKAGMNRHLSKPFDRKELQKVLAEELNK